MIVHLDRAGAMSEDVVRFYIAEIAMAIDYLHSKKIVHRYVPSCHVTEMRTILMIVI